MEDLTFQTSCSEVSLSKDALAFSDVLPDFSVWIVLRSFNMVSGLGPFHNVCRIAKRALGPSSSGSIDCGTHNAPLFLDWNFALFQLGKILCFKP